MVRTKKLAREMIKGIVVPKKLWVSLMVQQSRIHLPMQGDLGSIPGLDISSGKGNGTPIQYSCLRNPTDREAWQAIVHGVAKSQT